MYTRFRAWKRTNQPSPVAAAVADTPANQAQSRATAAAPTATTASTALHFVNTAHPEEATSSEVIGHIRSHVARKIHARRREVKKKQGTRPPPSGPEARGNHADKSHGRPKTGRAFPARRYSHVAAGTVCQIPPTRRSQLPAASLCVTPPPNLGAYLSRPLSDDECFLLDYCTL
ncbi:hypothetical protein BX600DRAFT_518934 [Xylariales sp. PMI_506]|nr:hypothetical protein BX600DRAFT_518934 [Xylariales sp. PMI_506]